MLPSSKCSPLLNIPPVSTQFGHHFCLLENQNSRITFRHYLNSSTNQKRKRGGEKRILNGPGHSLHRARLFFFIVGSPLILQQSPKTSLPNEEANSAVVEGTWGTQFHQQGLGIVTCLLRSPFSYPKNVAIRLIIISSVPSGPSLSGCLETGRGHR